MLGQSPADYTVRPMLRAEVVFCVKVHIIISSSSNQWENWYRVR